MQLMQRVRNNLWLARICRDWSTWHALKQRDAERTPEVHELALRGLRAPVLYRPGTSDLACVWEVFHGREYECRRGWDFRTVVDCGANVGVFLAYAAMKSGSKLARYVGVEPDAAAVGVLEMQVDKTELRPQSTLVRAAVWEHDGEVGFDDSGPSWTHHVRTDSNIAVPALTIDALLDRTGVDECDLLKLDVEGAERFIVPQMKDWGPRVRTLVAELHGGLDFDWFAAHADAAGFEPYPVGRHFRAHPSAVRRDHD